MNLQKLFDTINSAATAEMKKFNLPSRWNYEIANSKARELARSVGANEELCELGTMLMDIKLGECVSEGKQGEHIERSYNYASKLLEQAGADERTKNILLGCIRCHHGAPGGKYPSTEAEVVANADCYRFLMPIGAYGCIVTTTKWGYDQNKSVEFVKFKVNEKHDTLSLELAKRELEPNYKLIMDFLNSSKI